MFYINQSDKEKQQYKEMLKVVGGLSKLFSESTVPYLYYRAAENIFCRAFDAENLSRGDISFDAYKGDIAIGLKTFVHGNSKFEKVAEFNKDIDSFQNLSPLPKVKRVSELRNNRIKVTERAHNTNEDLRYYHLLTRKKNGTFNIYEEKMDLVDIDNIQVDTKNSTSKNILFTDGKHEYKFYIAKSTLYKKFTLGEPLESFEVEILDDPFEFLLGDKAKEEYLIHEEEEIYEQVVLPLYSARSGQVELKSGLNQWNAGGRDRNEDEVYVPIPSWIHKKFEGFFPYNPVTDEKGSFNLVLPNGNTLSASICQSGGKGFMSNPNKELGNWILRTVLKVPIGKLVTKQYLEEIGIDSVIVYKIDDNTFKMNFATTGTYDDFEEEYK